VGSVVAIVQEDVKRMLAYSSISHAGYVLMGFQADTRQGISSALFYLLTYTFMVVGSFAVVTVVGRRGDRCHRLDDYRGLGTSQPFLAGALTLFLLAQAGIPLTSGFVAKFAVFAATVEAREYTLTFFGVLTTVVAAFFYLRVIVLMYMTPPTDDADAADAAGGADAALAGRADGAGRAGTITLDPATGLAVGIAVVATVVLGVLPGAVISFARHATLLF
jgi:NADH-quinone oxidoreductase subunit N